MTNAEPSSLLHTAEIVHWGALAFMGVVYTTRILWLLKFKKPMDRSPRGGDGKVSPKDAGIHSLGNVAMPWGMESTRNNMGFYMTFVVFHLGVVGGITLAFLSSLAPSLMATPAVAYTLGGMCAAGFLVALYRVARRFSSPVLRLVSTPDDYFSLLMLTGWMGLGVIAQAHLFGVPQFADPVYLAIYLFATSFFLVYVPFSKISHYLYYPFTRFWLGKALGHRGSYPYAQRS